MFAYEAARIIIFAFVAFLVALVTTPFWYRVIVKAQLKKQIRTSHEAPVFSAYHRKKEGTPTAGGIIIWATVLGLAASSYLRWQRPSPPSG